MSHPCIPVGLSENHKTVLPFFGAKAPVRSASLKVPVASPVVAIARAPRQRSLRIRRT
jgi:hypothetical protein